MKATKLNGNTKILFKFLWVMSATLALLSCDLLESDPDILQPTANITGKEVFVLANGASFIDLNAKLQSNVPATVAITSQTNHGNLTDLGKGILQYIPTVGNATARDRFEFTVYGSNNSIIRRDSVIIIIETDSTHLPCNIYPIPDYVYGVHDQPVLIDVTSNDIICGGSVRVSVYKPGNTFPPYAGQAEVVGSKIKYTPGPGFDGFDKIMYKLTASNDTSRMAYGIVYITGDSSCSFRLSSDFYSFGENIIDSLLILPVFDNDSLCASRSQYQINLKSQPEHGHASIDTNGIQYLVAANAVTPFADHFDYELCIDAVCKTARIEVRVQKDSISNCVPHAFADSIKIGLNDAPIKYLKVLENDWVCGGLNSFKITIQPLYGISSIVDNTISYRRISDPEKDDTLEYEICNDQGCSRTTVLLKRNN